MSKGRLTLALAAVTLSVAAFAGVRQGTDPEEALKALNAWYTDQLKQARDNKTNPDFQALMTERTKRAKEAAAGIDAAKVEPAKALALAQLYQAAQQPKQQIDAAAKYLTSSPPDVQKYQAQSLMLSGYVATQDAAGIRKTLAEVKPPNAQTAAALASMTAGSYARVVAEKLGPQAALDLIKRAEAQVPYDALKTNQERVTGNGSIYSIGMARNDLYTRMGMKAEALAALEDARKRLIAYDPNEPAPAGANGSPRTYPDYGKPIESQLRLARLPGSAAPPVKQERGYGGFKGLEALRGKVVVLDFTAHW